MSVILGIDPGIGRTGWAFLRKIDSQENKLIDYGCLTTPTKKPVPERLTILFSELTELIAKHKPDVMAVEKLFFNTNAKTAIMVGQAMGTILLAGAQAKLDIRELTPLQVKISLTGYGRAEKGQVQKMVMTTLNLKKKPTPDDAADAIAVALCYALRNTDLE
jgi:crossover junction endodeoxyribonuclease RuvC